MSVTYVLLLPCPLIYTDAEIAPLRVSYETPERRTYRHGEMIYAGDCCRSRCRGLMRLLQQSSPSSHSDRISGQRRHAVIDWTRQPI